VLKSVFVSVFYELSLQQRITNGSICPPKSRDYHPQLHACTRTSYKDICQLWKFFFVGVYIEYIWVTNCFLFVVVVCCILKCITLGYRRCLYIDAVVVFSNDWEEHISHMARCLTDCWKPSWLYCLQRITNWAICSTQETLPPTTEYGHLSIAKALSCVYLKCIWITNYFSFIAIVYWNALLTLGYGRYLLNVHWCCCGV